MKWTIEYVEEQNYVRIIGEGVFSIREHPQKIEDIVSREYWQPGMALLFDNRKISFSETDIPTVRKASENFNRFSDRIGKSRVALLMNSLHDFARGRQFEMISEGNGSTNIRIFIEEKEAVKWLLS